MIERFTVIEAAFDRTMREFPGANPGALLVFARSTHLVFGPLTDADFQWARDRAAASARPVVATTDKQAAYAARRAKLREAAAPTPSTPKE